MSLWNLAFACGAAFGVATAANAEAAAPCAPTVIPPVDAPLDGETVPKNAVFIVDDADGLGDTLGLVGSVSGDLAVDVTTVEVAHGAAHRVVRAANGLPAGETVQLQRDGAAALTVTVGAADNNAAPVAPTAEAVGGYPANSCAPFTTLNVVSGNDDVIAFVAVVDSDDAPALGGAVAGFGAGPDLVVAVPDDGDHSISVAAVDVAGNVGVATSVEVPTFRSEAGCSGVPGLALVLPLLLRRRRRR